jgi:DNA-directed RNA polymerase specialized sigma subunit
MVVIPPILAAPRPAAGHVWNGLLQQHEALIHFIVSRQWPGEADYADLIQEGGSGCGWRSCDFDPERGFTFSTFAGRAIRNRVWNAVRQAGKAEGWLEPQRAGDSLRPSWRSGSRSSSTRRCRMN